VAPVALEQSEEQFLAAVREYAELLGWLRYHTHRSDRSEAGFPDLVLVRSGRMILAELKSEKGRATKAQLAWLEELRLVAEHSAAVQVFLWRPSDWPEIERQLQSKWPLV